MHADPMSESNDSERTRERMAELGRKSGQARRAKRSRGFLDVWKGRAHADPDELYDVLTRSTDGAVVVARVLEKAGALAPEPEPEPADAPGGSTFALRDLVVIAARTNQERLLLGFELTAEQRRELLEGEGDGGGDRHMESPHPGALAAPARTTDAPKTTPRPSDLPPRGPHTPPENLNSNEALARAVEIHAANRRELGLDEDDGNADLSGQRAHGVAPRVDGRCA